eukprot:6614999-Prymnesium_polylepis.1
MTPPQRRARRRARLQVLSTLVLQRSLVDGEAAVRPLAAHVQVLVKSFQRLKRRLQTPMAMVRKVD